MCKYVQIITWKIEHYWKKNFVVAEQPSMYWEMSFLWFWGFGFLKWKDTLGTTCMPTLLDSGSDYYKWRAFSVSSKKGATLMTTSVAGALLAYKEFLSGWRVSSQKAS